MINNRTDALKTDINLFFTIINCRIAGSRSLTRRMNFKFMCLSQGRGRRLLNFSYIDHPTKSDVTSGLNCTVQLVSQSEEMAFRFAKIFFYLQPIRFVSFQTEGRKMLQAHSFDFESTIFGKRQHFIIVLKENT